MLLKRLFLGVVQKDKYFDYQYFIDEVVWIYKMGKITRKKAREKLDKLQGYGRYSPEVYNYFKEKVM